MRKHTGTTSPCTTKTLDGIERATHLNTKHILFSVEKTHTIASVLKDPALDLAIDTIAIGKQALVFVNTKRSAEAGAEKIAKKRAVSERGKKLAEGILAAVSAPTKQCKRLAYCTEREIAFHHSGLTSKQRALIEDAFREGTIQVICATPTLCLSGKTKVWTGMEEVPVTQLGAKELTVLKDNSTVKIVNQDVVSQVHDASMISVHSVNGRTITTTPGHRFLIKRQGKKKLIEAQNIRSGDRIATLGRLHVEEKSMQISDIVKTYSAPDIFIDESIAYFIGAMLGDGYSGGTLNKDVFVPLTTPCLAGKDEEVRAHARTLLTKLGLSFREQTSTQGVPQLFLSKKRWFVEFMARCGVLQSTRKCINADLLYLPKTQAAALLRGYFDADGYVQKRGNVGVSSISLQLITDVQKLLLRFGIPSRMRRRKASELNISGVVRNTKPYYELIIATREGISRFLSHIGFGINRKQRNLELLASQQQQPLSISCNQCDYILSTSIFSGRTKQQQIWGQQKQQIVQILGEQGEMGSRELSQQLGFSPRKKEARVNAHYRLIQKRKQGSKSNTEWYWSLNALGEWVYRHRNHQPVQHLLFHQTCQLCGSNLDVTDRGNWRTNDFEGDIYWDIVRDVEQAPIEAVVYDVVLPNTPVNDHLFVAEGFFTHNSAGVDTPAFRSIIRDYKRFAGAGMQDIPVLEYHQMAGRAGRPDYGDDYGEAILVSKHEAEAQHLTEKYLYGEPEAIYSKVSSQPVLRTYTLSLIASEYVKTYAELVSFFSETFFAHQYQDIKAITLKLAQTIEQLREWGFLEKKGVDDFAAADELLIDMLVATPLGKRVSELYLDPLSAHKLLSGLRKEKNELFAYLHLVCSTQEMRPLLRIKPDDYEFFEEYLKEHKGLLEEPSLYDPDYEMYLEAAKTAKLLDDWADEKSEEHLLETYNARPGEVRARINIADWLLYGAAELSRITKQHRHVAQLQKARTRLKYGAREELLPLLRLKNVGRVRARVLHRNGVRTLQDLKTIDAGTLSQLLGPNIARDLKKQVGIDIDDVELSPKKRVGQLSLNAKKFQ